ncbi:MAG: hypothetical protein E7467_06630 [Ruminococcaceae bacterium]|nr:hypothetical protein [Oscillospiraceae bacterium]
MNLFLHATAHEHGSIWEMLSHAALDGLIDGAWSMPILFVAYLLMELLENSKRLNEAVLHHHSRKAGPAIGGILGIIPQCGISGAAATLFSTGSISVGTMLAVFFATSDEMLPLMLSSIGKEIDVSSLLVILLGKAALAIVLGYVADLILKHFVRSEKDIRSFCEREHCACEEDEGNVFLSALKHTLKIAAMLILVNIALNIVFELIGVEKLSAGILHQPLIGVLIIALFGLIPNCSISIVITQSYLSGLIGLGGLFAGLLANAGIGLLVLVRTNKNAKENLSIITVLLLLSVACGMCIDIFC